MCGAQHQTSACQQVGRTSGSEKDSCSHAECIVGSQGRQVQACMHERRRFPGSGEQRPGAPYMDMKIGVFHCRVDLESLSPPTCSIRFLCSSPFAQPSFCIPFCSSMLVRLQTSGAQFATSEFCFRLLPCSGSGFKNTHIQKTP